MLRLACSLITIGLACVSCSSVNQIQSDKTGNDIYSDAQCLYVDSFLSVELATDGEKYLFDNALSAHITKISRIIYGLTVGILNLEEHNREIDDYYKRIAKSRNDMIIYLSILVDVQQVLEDGADLEDVKKELLTILKSDGDYSSLVRKQSLEKRFNIPSTISKISSWRDLQYYLIGYKQGNRRFYRDPIPTTGTPDSEPEDRSADGAAQ